MRTILLAAALALSVAPGCSKASKSDPGAKPAASAQAEAPIPSMTVDEVEHALAAKEMRAVDCNPETTRKRMGVVPGAILLSNNETYAASELPADKSAKLVFYCANSG